MFYTETALEQSEAWDNCFLGEVSESNFELMSAQNVRNLNQALINSLQLEALYL